MAWRDAALEVPGHPSNRRVRAAVLFATMLFGGCGADSGWAALPEAESVGWLMNVWAPDEEHQFFVGGNTNTGVVRLREGGEYRDLDLPEGTDLVTWGFGFGPNDVTFVAEQGQILHWNGATMESQSTPTTEDLWGVWGTAPDDLWAVGGSGLSGAQAVILHYDGAAWEVSPIPELAREARGLFKVWGTGPDNVYAVGHLGVVLHWTGAEWTEEFVGASQDIVSLWGTGPDDIVAVGGRSIGQISYWNGTEWQTELYGPAPGLNGVWMNERGLAYTSGLRGTLLTVELPSFEIIDESVASPLGFHSIHGVGNRLTAVGGNIGATDSAVGLAYERTID